MRARLIAFILNRAAVILLIALTLTGFCAYQLVDFNTATLKIDVDASLTGLLPAHGPSIDTFKRVRREFGGDDVLLVAWFDADLFSAAVLERLKRFSRRVRRIDGVDRVDGLATAISVRDAGDTVRIEKFLHRIPKTAEGLAALRSEALTNPLYRGQFVSHDGRGTLIAVHFDPDLDTTALARAVTDVATASREEAGDVEQFISGPIHARLEISRILFRDIRLALPLAILLTAGVAALSFRNIRGVVLPLFSTGLGLSLTLVAFVAAGHALNFVTAIAPPVIFVVGFAFAMHVIAEFDRSFTLYDEKTAAVKQTIEEVFTPLTLTALTTTVGFASLSVSPISSIRSFGIYTAMGTSLCWLMALAVIPAGLIFLPVRITKQASRSWLASKAPTLARFDIKYRRWIFASGAVIVVLSIASALRLEVSTDYLSNFSADSEVRANFSQVRERFTGAIPLQILVESDVQNAFTDPIHLKTIEAFESWLEDQPEIGSVVSLIDYIGVVNQAFAEDNAETPWLPATRGEIEDLLFLTGSDEADRFVDNRYQNTVMHVRTSAVSSKDLAALIERIDARLAILPSPLRGEVTGSSALLARTLNDIVYGQLISLAGALAVIYIILIVLFGSSRVAALALLPNILPIICFFGILGISGITLNLATSLVAAVVLGIAVDDTMHFLSRFNTEARRLASEAQGVEAALTSVIRPATFTTAALCCGFMALTLGELRSQVEFGALAAATLLVAWFIDVIFTPALAGHLRFVTLWEVLTLDLGEAPHKTIPLFSGLSNREARIAAIMGSINTFNRGDSIIKTGDEGGDVHLVIEGEAKAYLDRDNGEQILRRVKRGDLIGEVALFSGVRTANVDAETEMRLLRLTDKCFDRIQDRYPRIAAQLYRNLGRTLADRLSDVTGRL